MYTRRNILWVGAILMSVLMLSSCGGAKLSTANEQMAKGEYFDASKTYRKVYNKLTKREERPLRGEIAFKMAQCYDKLGMAANATAAYQNAIRYQYEDSTLHLRLARSLHAEGKYPAAVKEYEEYLAYHPEDDAAVNGLLGARMGATRDGATRYVVKNAKLFNSRRADYSPMFFDKSYDVIYFTTTNEKVVGDKRSEINGMKKADIWFSRKNEQGKWMRPEPVEGDLNTDREEGTPTFTPDGATMYLSKARREPNANTGVEIYSSQRSDAKWNSPVKYEITADTISNYGHPAVSPDGQIGRAHV